jgi:hypothetical protein
MNSEIRKFIMVAFLLMSSAGCLVLPPFDGEQGEKQRSGSSSQAKVTSCLGLLENGNYVRCSEQRNSDLQAKMKEVCGDESKGMKGYKFFDKECPAENRVGTCAYSDEGKDTMAYDFWYQPTYTQNSAHDHCRDLGGKFSWQ